MKKKLSLASLKVTSFVTELEKYEEGTLRGGDSIRSCARGTCPKVKHSKNTACLKPKQDLPFPDLTDSPDGTDLTDFIEA